MKNAAVTFLLAAFASLGVRSHHYGQPRMTHPGYYSSDPENGSVPNAPQQQPIETSPPAPLVPSQPAVKPETSTPSPQLQSGFQPSAQSFQRGTREFEDGVRRGLVRGLEEFLGVPGPRAPSNSGSSVTYANPSRLNQPDSRGLSYNAPGAFVFGHPRATVNSAPISQSGYVSSRPVTQSGYAVSPTTFQQASSRPQSGGYQSQNGQYSVSGGGQSVGGPQQASSHISWFRQGERGALSSAASSLGRFAPTDYQQQGQGSQASITSYVRAAHPQQYQTYSHQ